jgi:hypothetical protein
MRNVRFPPPPPGNGDRELGPPAGASTQPVITRRLSLASSIATPPHPHLAARATAIVARCIAPAGLVQV